MERAIRPSFSVGQPLAKAAIDLACHDLWGKQVDQPVCRLLGKSSVTEIQLSWTINATSLDKAHEQLEQGRTAGYTSYNVKIGAPQTPDYDRSLVRAVREFAPHGFHWADANASFDLAPPSAWPACSPTPASRRSNRRCRPTACAITRS